MEKGYWKAYSKFAADLYEAVLAGAVKPEQIETWQPEREPEAMLET